MTLETLNKVCFAICMACITAGALLALAMIWWELGGDELFWKLWQTIGTVFVAAALTLAISKSMESKVRDGD